MKYNAPTERSRILAVLLAHLQAGRMSAQEYARWRRYVQAEHASLWIRRMVKSV